MASSDWNAEVLEGTVYSTQPLEGTPDAYPASVGSATTLLLGAGNFYFKMRGMDQVTAGLYNTWVVFGVPDFTATYYTGSLNLPLRDVVIDSSWTA